MRRRGWWIAGAAALSLVALCGLAAARWVRALGPLDLARAREGSPIAVDRTGRLLRPFTTADGRWKLPVTATEVDAGYLTLLKTYEDQRFDQHRGIDVRALARAVWQLMAEGRIVSGASTLTMQVARLLEPREERSLAAKARQMVRAVQLERMAGKGQILDYYLTLAPYGGNIEGVRAAALAYFGKEPRRLSLAEAALLVALPQSPEARRPDRFPEAARRARDRVLALAVARGAIAPGEAEAARAEPVPLARKPFPMVAPHQAEAALRAVPGERVHRLTLDYRLQTALEALARERAASLPAKSALAIVAIDNASGELRAAVGGADLFDTTRAGAMDLTQAIRSPGSALKPFIYALAFDSGIAHPETMLEDRPSRFSAYSPENFDLTYQGSITARVALQQSLNVPAVDLLSEVGPFRFIARLRAAGADVVLPRDSAPGLAAALGGLGIRLTDLARLYAGLARGGATLPLATRVDRVLLPGGERALTGPVAAWYVSDTLRGTPPPAHALPGQIAFKTGTSYGYRDAWAAGFDRETTIAVWVGRPDGAPVPGMTGRTAAAPVLFDAFARRGGETPVPPRPRDVLVASNASLPMPLRHLRKDLPKTVASASAPSLKIAYPPDGARIDLGLKVADERSALMLKASGGQMPLIWLVNGRPVQQGEFRRQAHWQPDGTGFVRVTVMDATGASDTVHVRLE